MLKGYDMFIEKVQRLSDIVCSRDATCWRANSWDITDVKDGKLSNLRNGYNVTNNIYNITKVKQVFENVSNKYSVKILFLNYLEKVKA
jgi:hypothetical protein